MDLDASLSALRASVVIPIRTFAHGKARLAPVLDDEARSTLLRSMAERVVAAAGAMPTLIVSSAPEVGSWARSAGLEVAPDPGSLDGAAAAGLAWSRACGADRVVVAHADLAAARPGSLAELALDGDARMLAIVPCHRDDGSPVLSIPSDVDFPFAYGAGSFARHVAAAAAVGLGVRIVRDAQLGFDVDLPEDLAALDALPIAR